MSRSERLFDLLDVLRRYRGPVSGKTLADAVGISIRTLYRDIASLQALGATIEGEPGVGYVLRPGFLLPPLSFPSDEIEALVLGARWVAGRGDDTLKAAAQNALARIATVLPSQMRDEMEAASLLVGPGAAMERDTIDPVVLRKAIRSERKLRLDYRDGNGAVTTRIVWPFALAFFDRARLLVAWCELREGFRSFRTDRIARVDVVDARYPRRRQVLIKEWRREQGIPNRD